MLSSHTEWRTAASCQNHRDTSNLQTAEAFFQTARWVLWIQLGFIRVSPRNTKSMPRYLVPLWRAGCLTWRSESRSQKQACKKCLWRAGQKYCISKGSCWVVYYSSLNRSVRLGTPCKGVVLLQSTVGEDLSVTISASAGSAYKWANCLYPPYLSCVSFRPCRLLPYD